MKKRHILAVVAMTLVLAAGIVLAIVLLNRPRSTDGESSPGASPTFTVWHSFGSDAQAATYLEDTVLPKFQQSHDAMVVEAVFHEETEMRNLILSARQSDTLPDVVFVNPEWLPELVRLDILAPLGGEGADLEAMADGLLEGALDAGRRGESVYGLPVYTSTNVMLYSPALLDQAGTAVPATLDAFFSAVGAVSAIGADTYGLGMPGLTASALAPYFWSNGGELTNAAQTGASGAIDGSANVTVVEAFAELAAADALYLSDGDTDALAELFAAGKLGMVMADAALVDTLRANHPEFAYEIMQMPTGQGEPHTMLESTLVAVTVTANADAALELVELLVGTEAQTNLAACGLMPANKTALESAEAQAAAFAPLIPSLLTARPLPNVGEWQEMDKEFGLAMTQVVQGYKPAKQALADLAKTWDALLP